MLPVYIYDTLLTSTPFPPLLPGPSLPSTLQTLKSQGKKMSPQEVAGTVLANLESNSTVMERVRNPLSHPLTLSFIHSLSV